jgi:hypothetical protein
MELYCLFGCEIGFASVIFGAPPDRPIACPDARRSPLRSWSGLQPQPHNGYWIIPYALPSAHRLGRMLRMQLNIDVGRDNAGHRSLASLPPTETLAARLQCNAACEAAPIRVKVWSGLQDNTASDIVKAVGGTRKR